MKSNFYILYIVIFALTSSLNANAAINNVESISEINLSNLLLREEELEQKRVSIIEGKNINTAENILEIDNEKSKIQNLILSFCGDNSKASFNRDRKIILNRLDEIIAMEDENNILINEIESKLSTNEISDKLEDNYRIAKINKGQLAHTEQYWKKVYSCLKRQ